MVKIRLLLLISIYLRLLRKRRRKRPVTRVNPYLRLRKEKGRFAKDLQDLKNYPPAFKENFHMPVETFNKLLDIVREDLEPKKRCRPDSFTAEEKLAITLEYLASGSYQRHIASIYRASKSVVGKIIHQTCTVIYRKLSTPYLNQPSRDDWLKNANKFHSLWNMPNCLGAIDGKHIAITAPPNSASLFYNHKGFFSIILMAICDAEYKFSYLDIGGYGSEGDANAFRDSSFGKSLFDARNPLRLPPDTDIWRTKVPYYFVGDDAFPLHERIMKPYVPRKPKTLSPEERIFNYRLSRARRCIENAFGILGSRWRVLARTMQITPGRGQAVVAACCALHNFLMQESQNVYCPEGFADSYGADGSLIEGTWRSNLPSASFLSTTIAQTQPGRQPDAAKIIRDHLKNYFNSDVGSVPWQQGIFSCN